jgi:cyclopropane fatty-acyl-phospholipid synthase-like methyltransferase
MENLPKEENWDNFWKDNTKSRFTKKSWSKIRIMTLLDKVVRDGMNVLDAGSGSGFFSNYFISKDCNVYSLDYSEDALAITRRLTGDKSTAYIREDLLDSGFSEKYAGQFDIIFSDGLFEHFNRDDQKKIMDNFKKVKKDEGIITTFVPNKYSWWEIVRPFFMPGIKEEPFTMKKMIELHQPLELKKRGGINVLPIKFSPDKSLGSKFGMILYCFAK